MSKIRHKSSHLRIVNREAIGQRDEPAELFTGMVDVSPDLQGEEARDEGGVLFLFF